MEPGTKASGKTMFSKVTVSKTGQMATATKDSTSEAKKKEKAHSSGETAQNITVAFTTI